MTTSPATGRLVRHDPRSRAFPARRADHRRTVLHRHAAPVLHQGNLGACTGFASAQMFNCSMFAGIRPKRWHFDDRVAKRIYSRATQLDEFNGQWPPTDTGSSGLGAMQAAKEFGYITEYHHAFGLDHMLDSLVLSPCIVGTSWYTDMAVPDGAFYVKPGGRPDGGHEYLCLGANFKTETLLFLNSWGPNWSFGGRFKMRFDVFGALLEDQGDATFPIGAPK